LRALISARTGQTLKIELALNHWPERTTCTIFD
jgi:hypothetical protein